MLVLTFAFFGMAVFLFVVTGYDIGLSKGDSMKPTMEGICVAFQKAINSIGDVKIGDIVVYRNKFREKIVHRVIESDCPTLYFELKGDNNLDTDGCIPYSNIHFKILKFWCLG